MVIAVLEKLKTDPSLYVRKSVANNLNDIAKDHSSVVLEAARLGKVCVRIRVGLYGRVCRTLTGRADPEVLELFGYANPNDVSSLETSVSL